MKLNSNHHSVFSLTYHLILTTKYCKKVISDDIATRLKEIFEYYELNQHIEILEWIPHPDYIHVVFQAHPMSEISKFINLYKSMSSRLIKQEYPDIRKDLWDGQFWSKTFCLMTSGEIDQDIISDFIMSQSNTDNNVNKTK